MTSKAVIAASSALSAMAGLTLLGAAANAQATCEWYARTALQQQKVNIDRKCGFKGESWSSDRAAHLAWCATTPPDQWKRQAQMREQMLGKCLAGQK